MGGGGENEQACLGVDVTRLTFHHRCGVGLEDGCIVGPIGIQTVVVRWGRPAMLTFFAVAHYGLATMITRATTNTPISAPEQAATCHPSDRWRAVSGESSLTRR